MVEKNCPIYGSFACCSGSYLSGVVSIKYLLKNPKLISVICVISNSSSHIMLPARRDLYGKTFSAKHNCSRIQLEFAISCMIYEEKWNIHMTL